MLNEAWFNAFFVETLLDIGFHTLSLINSTIWEKSSASYAHALAKNSVDDFKLIFNSHVCQGWAILDDFIAIPILGGQNCRELVSIVVQSEESI